MLDLLSRVPPAVVAIAIGALVVTALVIGTRWSALLLLPVLALLVVLTLAAWPRLSRGHRLIRLVVLGALLGWTAATLVTG